MINVQIRIGFARQDITPPLGTELGGYAAHRPCSGVHDPLLCKAVVLEQDGVRYALIAFDLLCVDEALYNRIAGRLSMLGIEARRIIACAIHTHASPRGVVPGEGPLAAVNRSSDPKSPDFPAYIEGVVEAAGCACEQAIAQLEPFKIRWAQGALPEVGSDRHTGESVRGVTTAAEMCTQSGKRLIIYNFPCHPTVMSAANLQVSADFAAGVEKLLGADMAVFLNGAAGDVSTRFTRKESTFEECARFAGVTAQRVAQVLEPAEFAAPTPLCGLHERVTLAARKVESEEEAQRRLDELTKNWKEAETSGADAATVRTLKSYAEGAGLNLQFARSMGGIRELHLPVTVFSFSGLRAATIPGELFSALQPHEPLNVISYANGYYRYIADEGSYDAGYYEALAAIVARGEGEKLVAHVQNMINRLP